jgi:polyhydroxybutyrate depolymerase
MHRAILHRTMLSWLVPSVLIACGGGGDGGGGGGTTSGSGATVATTVSSGTDAGSTSTASGAATTTSSATTTTSTAVTATSTMAGSIGAGGSSSTTASITTGSGGTQTAEPSTGCGSEPSHSENPSVMSGGVARTYVIDLPAGYDPDTAYPIVFGFHGMGTSGTTFRSAFYGNLLSAMADEAIVVHPDAIGDPTAWGDAEDIAFFDDLLAQLQATLCIDAARVFATGHSSGGFFTNTLACQRADVLRGIAPVSGGGPFRFGNNSCVGPVAAWLAHGENDETVAFSSGEGSRDHWLEANGCEASSATASIPSECVEYTCSAGLPVRWCVYQEGHDWPDFAPQGMWDFFKSL